MLKEVNVNVSDVVEILDNVEFREGNMNIYKLIFNMSQELNDLLSVAVFTTETGEVYKRAIIDGKCYVPFDALKRKWMKLGVYSYKENELIHSPAPTEVFVGEGSYVEGSLTEDEFDLNDYERYLEANQKILDEIKTLTDGLNEKVLEVEEKLENGDFDGYTPQRGTDYWTEQDKNEIKSDLQPTLDNNLKEAKDYTDNSIARDFKDISYNNETATFLFTRHDGTIFTVDLPIEQTVKNGRYDETTKELVLVLVSNQEIRIPASGLIDDYTGVDSATIQVVISADNKITCNINAGSITKTLLTIELQEEINNKLNKTDIEEKPLLITYEDKTTETLKLVVYK